MPALATATATMTMQTILRHSRERMPFRTTQKTAIACVHPIRSIQPIHLTWETASRFQRP